MNVEHALNVLTNQVATLSKERAVLQAVIVELREKNEKLEKEVDSYVAKTENSNAERFTEAEA